MGSIGKRIVSQGYLLYEYLNDDDTYTLVGVIDSALGSHAINPQTGIATDQEEADEFFKTGKVNFKVKQDERLSAKP
jgi:hypothetical protein